MKKILTFCFTAIIIATSTLKAQEYTGLWSPINESQIPVNGERTIIPNKYKTYHITENAFKQAVFTAPSEKNITLANSPVIIELPMPDATFQKFRVVESPVMAPELAVQFPDIKTFNVQNISNQAIYGKLDWNDFGFHAMLRTTNGDIFIDPYCRNNKTDYIVYYASDFIKEPAKVNPEIGVIEPPSRDKKKEKFSANAVKASRTTLCAGTDLRTYRLAIACTGEYAQAATGLSSPSISQILSAVVTTVNRVDGVYETEVATKLVLIAGETSLLFADENTDPFTANNDGNTLIDESQQVIDNIIGANDYDIGHTFSTGAGGLAYLGVVCYDGYKASGITGRTYPVGDPYDIDYVAHEIGHQFSGQHTFTASSGSCSGNANPTTEVEPGSGITIMAYAGICSYNDLAPHSIPYFHTISFDQIMEYINDYGYCAVTTPTSNNTPAVTTTPIHTIPKGTPFILTGSATDSDGDALTYQWEETDLGNDTDWNSGDAPYFRSYSPIPEPSRMFPKLSVVLSGNYTDTIGEYLPSTSQTLNFRLIARDNKVGGGGLCYAATEVFIAGSGPFEVTSPNTNNITWISGNTQTVTWNVNGTDNSPVSCANVNILYSTDGGATFTMLTPNTPNDGSQTITAPTVTSSETDCRIKVECADNIFFDINNQSFTINPITTGINSSTIVPLAIQLTPNPFNTEFQLQLSGINKQKTTLKIYDVLGNILITDTFNGMEQLNKQYSLESISSGVYFVEISNQQQKQTTRLIKQ